jgi:fumarate reductase flavoprotein subunit
MGMWIGAAIDDAPHCVMYFDKTGPDAPIDPPSSAAEAAARPARGGGFVMIARQPWLNVNINGERFMNEDLPWAYESNQIIIQPKSSGWKIWDRKFDQEWEKFNCQCCKNMGRPLYSYRPDALTSAVATGVVLAAPTLEELATKIEVPFKALKATVERYNEMTRNGKDIDFGKNPERMTTVEKPPFYACRSSAQYLVTLGGLKINTKLQVLDTERNAIPGLYAAGNVSGSFWGDEYPTTIAGASHSRAWTFGRLAGLAAAAEKV